MPSKLKLIAINIENNIQLLDAKGWKSRTMFVVVVSEDITRCCHDISWKIYD